ncbi:PREDICTED: uncharacterized protein LOC109169670 [Ipomoea nil]|uniref:uncharacterized protein LOC109169670 n=1 Tax=Ipomoea nil TaxID=35883 RepID=UPI000901709B|nr:PREDICTED: uncharacterized protein LOC109169670 [Ipomoea nil]
MMQTLKPYSTTAKTAEIMARYRPIAPKPEASGSPSSPENSNALPQSISKSPFLRNIWPHLQARPTRTRKRGRSALAPPPLKRPRACLQGLSPPYNVMASPAKSWSLRGFVHNPNGLPQIPILPNLAPLKCGLDNPVSTIPNSITVPFLSRTSPPSIPAKPLEPTSPRNRAENSRAERGIDLNMAAEVPEEIDFISQFRAPAVITPRPVRPVGSNIYIGCITNDDRQPGEKLPKKPEEVENEVETEELPAVVSDSNNKVRLANSAYKEMVGQPECRWLDYTAYGDGKGGGSACKRISGEVILQFLDSCDVPLSSDRFTCWVRIEWRSNDKKNSVRALCDAVKLACQSKDYLFQWRFHTKEHSSESASNIKSTQV